MNNPLISIIIPVFNGEKFIERSINSVLNQEYDNVELIVIDDGSTDRTAIIVKAYDKVIYNYQKNKGVSAARNLGIKIAKGSYVGFLDCDDYVLPKMYSTLAKWAIDHNLDIVSCGFYQENNKGNRREVSKQQVILSKSDKNYALKAFNTFGNNCWNKLFKKTLIATQKFINIKRGEDGLFVLEAYLRANKVGHINTSYYIYYQNFLSVTNSNIDQKVIDNYIFTNNQKLKIVSKYGYMNELERALQRHFYDYFLMYTNKIRIKKHYAEKQLLWEKWLHANEKLLKNTSLTYITAISKNINVVFFTGMIITGRMIKKTLQRLKYFKFYYK